MSFKLVVADPKTGKSYKLETEETSLLGLKIGEKFQGDSLGLAGYELELTGGSDKTGTPMRKDVKGSIARRIILTKGVGFHAKKPGERRKKRVFGYKIGADIVQVNFKVTKPGAQPLDKLIAPAEKKEESGAPKAEAPAETVAPAEEKKEEAKPEEKPAESKLDAPKEEKEEVAKPVEEAKPEEKKEESGAPKEEKSENRELKTENQEPIAKSEEPKPEAPAEEKKEEVPAEEKDE